MNTKELLSLIALQHIPGIGSITAKRLVESIGSATQVFEYRTDLPTMIRKFNHRLSRRLTAHQPINALSENWTSLTSIILPA